MILQNGNLEFDPTKILHEQENFYRTLYSSTLSLDPADNDFTSTSDLPRLDTSDQEICDLDITCKELGEALKDLPNDKTPGNDGLSTNFYKLFWPNIKDVFF